ncbi:MAG: alpha/beta fold hydrolase [Nocardioidaceae bacterium]
MPSPALSRLDVREPRGAVLLLHGGRQRSDVPVDGRSASWRLAQLLQREVALSARRRDVAVWALRYGVRGWNGGRPVQDARWALDRMRADLGDLPVVLVGHSMGGRTAISVADDPRVVGVVGLAPWIAEDTPTAPLTGKRLVAAHGRADRITSFGATRAFTERAARVAASARFLDMGPLGHYLLRGHQRWRRIAADESLGMLAADAG